MILAAIGRAARTASLAQSETTFNDVARYAVVAFIILGVVALIATRKRY